MQMLRKPRSILREWLLGPWDLAYQWTLGLEDPQSDVSVWLHGLGPARDVTESHLMACGSPFTICIGFDQKDDSSIRSAEHLTLHFYENSGHQRLGEIKLGFVSSLRVDSQTLCFFRAVASRNYCLPRRYLWPRSLRNSLQQRSAKDGDVPITARESRAMAVFYVCPRPVVLVSVADGQEGNMFPMNVMGPVGNGYFAFGLNSSRSAAPLVERAGRAVLSSIPFERASMATSLRTNHRKSSIDWNQLPFATSTPQGFGVPVPDFAMRIREMQVEAIHKLGSHTLFVSKTIRDKWLTKGPQFFVAHGIYHAWLQRTGLDRNKPD